MEKYGTYISLYLNNCLDDCFMRSRLYLGHSVLFRQIFLEKMNDCLCVWFFRLKIAMAPPFPKHAKVHMWSYFLSVCHSEHDEGQGLVTNHERKRKLDEWKAVSFKTAERATGTTHMHSTTISYAHARSSHDENLQNHLCVLYFFNLANRSRRWNNRGFEIFF